MEEMLVWYSAWAKWEGLNAKIKPPMKPRYEFLVRYLISKKAPIPDNTKVCNINRLYAVTGLKNCVSRRDRKRL